MNVTNIYSNPLLLSITFYPSHIQTHVIYHSLRCSFTISGKTMKCIKSSFRPPCSSFDRTLRPRNRETIDVSSFPLLVPLSTSFSQPVHSKTRLFFPSFQARKLTDATTRAQLTEKRAVWIDSANVSARLNTATGEISRNLGAIERGAGAILCDRGGWPISLQPTRQLYVSVG